MTLPDPTLPLSRPEDITSLYPYFIDFLRNSVGSFNPHHTQFYSTRGMRRLSKTKTQSTITTSGSMSNISNGYYSFTHSTAPLLLRFLLFSVWDRNSTGLMISTCRVTAWFVSSSQYAIHNSNQKNGIWMVPMLVALEWCRGCYFQDSIRYSHPSWTHGSPKYAARRPYPVFVISALAVTPPRLASHLIRCGRRVILGD